MKKCRLKPEQVTEVCRKIGAFTRPVGPQLGKIWRHSHSPSTIQSWYRLPSSRAQPNILDLARKERCTKHHKAPNHISKTVPPTVHSGPLEQLFVPLV